MGFGGRLVPLPRGWGVVADICFRTKGSVRVGIVIRAAGSTVVVVGKSADWMVDLKKRRGVVSMLEGQWQPGGCISPVFDSF